MIELDINYDRADNKISAEQQLWQAVLLRTIEDARGLVPGANSYPERAQLRAFAYEWLTRDDNADRELVCDYAGVDAVALHRWACAQPPPPSSVNVAEEVALATRQPGSVVSVFTMARNLGVSRKAVLNCLDPARFTSLGSGRYRVARALRQ